MQLLFEIRIRKTCKPLTLDHFTSHDLNLHKFDAAIDMIKYRSIGVYSLHIREDTR